MISGTLLWSVAYANVAFAAVSVRLEPPMADPGRTFVNALVESGNAAGTLRFDWGPTTDYGYSAELEVYPNGFPQRYSTVFTNSYGSLHIRATLQVGAETIVTPNTSIEGMGPAGQAIALRGTDYLEASFEDGSFIGEDFAIEAWLLARGPGAIFRETALGDESNWDAIFAEILTDGAIRIAVPGIEPFTVEGLRFDEWHHFALSYQKATGNLSAYLDGVLFGSAVGDRQTPHESGLEAKYFIGKGGSFSYRGALDEFRVWNRHISSAQTAQLYLRTLRFPDDGLIACWTFDNWDWLRGGDSLGYVSSRLVSSEAGISREPSVPAVTNDGRPYLHSSEVTHITPTTLQVRTYLFPANSPTTVTVTHTRAGQTISTRQEVAGEELVIVTNYLSNLAPGAIYEIASDARNSFGQAAPWNSTVEMLPWAGRAFEGFIVLDPNIVEFPDAFRFSSSSLSVELWAKPEGPGILVSESSWTFGGLDWQTLSGPPRAADIVIIFPPSPSKSLLEILPSREIVLSFGALPPVSLGAIPLGVWSHIAFRYNAAKGFLEGFVNGVKSGAVRGATTIPGDYGLVVSALHGANGNGAIDEVRIWDGALTDSELESRRFNRLVSDESQLLGYWRFDTPFQPMLDSGPRRLQAYSSDDSAQPVSDVPLTFGFLKKSQQEIELQFVVEPGSRQRIEISSDLVEWVEGSEAIAPPHGIIRVPVAVEPSSSSRIYRLTQPD